MKTYFSALKQRFETFYSSPHSKRFLRMLALAIVLRMLIMPFFGHMDVLSEARRVYYWQENNLLFHYGSRNATYLIEAINMRIFKPLLPEAQSMMAFQDMRRSTASIHSAFKFVSHPTIHRTLFIFKLPYLFCDILIAFLLFAFKEDRRDTIRSCKLWLFNPITIFSFYIFGRFESIPLLFLTAALLCAKKERYIWSAVLFALCLNAREMMNFYFPIICMATLVAPLKEIDFKKKLLIFGIMIIAVMVSLQLLSFVFDLHKIGGQNVTSVMKEKRASQLFAFAIHGIPVIVFIYGLLLIWIWNSTQPFFEKILLACTMAIFSFFVFSSHTAHFMAWMVVFPCIYAADEKRLVRPFIAVCLSWIGFWLFMTDKGVFTLWLAAPFSLYFTAFPNIPELYTRFNHKINIFDLPTVIFCMRALFDASLCYVGFQILRLSVRAHNKELSP